MKTKILLLAGMCLGLAACESMDLVRYPDHKVIPSHGTQPKQNCAWLPMTFTFWVIGKNLLVRPNNGRITLPIVRRTVIREVAEPYLMEP